MNLAIRQERIKRGWTQGYVAGQVGISASMFQKIETAQRRPSYSVLLRLEQLFGLPHSQLFEAVDSVHNPLKS